MTPWEEVAIPPRLKLSLLWVSTVLCYLYADYFELYLPGKLSSMMAGQIAPLGPVTQGVMLQVGLLLLVPSLLVALSLLGKPWLVRNLNLLCGVGYTALMALLAVKSNWRFYQLYAVCETLLTACIVYVAWTWPKASTSAR